MAITGGDAFRFSLERRADLRRGAAAGAEAAFAALFAAASAFFKRAFPAALI